MCSKVADLVLPATSDHEHVFKKTCSTPYIICSRQATRGPPGLRNGTALIRRTPLGLEEARAPLAGVHVRGIIYTSITMTSIIMHMDSLNPELYFEEIVSTVSELSILGIPSVPCSLNTGS